MDEKHNTYLISRKPPKVGTAEVDDQTRLSDTGLIREYFAPETKMKLHHTKGILGPVSYTKHGENHKKLNTLSS